MVNEIQVKTILNKHKKRDEWFLDDYSVNPYYGCPFNCVYCYLRGSKYGENMAKTLSVKLNAPAILAQQLKRRALKGEYGIICFASQEAYIPIEAKYEVTRKMLEVTLTSRFPVHICTKSPLVLRDLDILKELDTRAILPEDLRQKLNRGVIISFSFSTLDERVAQIFEPGAPAPEERLETLSACKNEGFLVGANFIPVLPFISDSGEQLDAMIQTAKAHGADFVLVGGLTLFGDGPADCKTLYYRALEKYASELVPCCKKLFRTFFAPPRAYQNELEAKSRRLCTRYGMRYGILSSSV
ncbi:MAG: radical SAM protein [Methanophagales archaeon ANME-1-THS]|nr:MAG: radical SAM protein [Methanophagales archaeon ANME-1-THS]